MKEAITIPRRMAAVPAPLADEYLGSWLARLAVAHFTSRSDLVRAFLAEGGENGIDIPELHYSSKLAPGLIEVLSKRTGLAPCDLSGMSVPDSLVIVPCEPSQTESYCPLCWRDERARGTTHYIRKNWCERWTVLCEVHNVPLRTSRMSVERLLGRGANSPAWLGESRASMWPIDLCASLIRAQRLIRERATQQGALSEEEDDRARVLIDIALFVGTAFDGGFSLIDQSVDLESALPRSFCWRERHVEGSAFADEPIGTLEVRQLALRLAVLIFSRMTHSIICTRPEDIASLAALNLLPHGSTQARACDRMLRAWPAQYRASWELAFGWPERGGAGYFVRRYGRVGAGSYVAS